MRVFSKVSPKFWTRGSGKRLRGDALGQVVGAYLMTSPHATMIGLYYCALPTIAAEIGHSPHLVRKALGRVAEVGFAFYDREAELVWVPNMARENLGETLKLADNRRKAIPRLVKQVGNHRFVIEFWEQYQVDYNLGPCPVAVENLRGFVPTEDPSEAPSKLKPSAEGGEGEGDREGDREGPGDPKGSGALSEDQSIQIVFATWVSLHVSERGRESAVLNADRRKRIRARLQEGYTAGRLQAALRGALADRWLMGVDPKSPRPYRGLETLLRDGSQVERLELLDGQPPADPSGAAPIGDFSDVDGDAEMERFNAELEGRKRRRGDNDG